MKIRERCHIHKVKGQRGFTLLEVMITMVILAIGLLGLAGLQIIAIKGNSYGQQMTVASTMAQNQLEQMRQGAVALVTSNDFVTDSNGITYTRTWTVTPNTPNQNMNTVEIDVSWAGPLGSGDDAQRSITLRTIM
jgi:type IV pilus assembly protein PilV